MADNVLSLRERAEFLLRVAPRASTPRARASLESLAQEYLRKADDLEKQAKRPMSGKWAFRPPQT
jgi:hypothetical protein